MNRKCPRVNKIKHTINKLIDHSIVIVCFVPVVLSIYCHVLRDSIRRTDNDLT